MNDDQRMSHEERLHAERVADEREREATILRAECERLTREVTDSTRILTELEAMVAKERAATDALRLELAETDTRLLVVERLLVGDAQLTTAYARLGIAEPVRSPTSTLLAEAQALRQQLDAKLHEYERSMSSQ